jgi:hypothetical protein
VLKRWNELGNENIHLVADAITKLMTNAPHTAKLQKYRDSFKSLPVVVERIGARMPTDSLELQCGFNTGLN